MKRLIVLFGVAGVSLSAVFVRWSAAPALILALYRMAFAAALLAPVALRRREEWKALTRRDVGLCLVSGAFLGMHFAAYFTAVKETSIASSVLLVNTEVLFVALGTVILFRQKLSGKAWAAILLAFGGSAVIALGDAGAGGALRGDLIALAGAVFMSVYTMIGSVCRRRISTSVYTFLVYSAAGVTLAVTAAVCRRPLAGYAPVDYLSALGMAVFCTLLGHSVFSWGLKYLPAAFVSTMKLLEAVFASVWGVAFGELPDRWTVLGGLIVLGGIGVYNSTSRLEDAGAAEPSGAEYREKGE